MNKAKGNMYGFVTHTWNPITGKCIHDCSYCYMKKWKLNDVHLNEKVLNQDLGKDNYIFVGSGTDMFADNVREEWIIKTLRKCMSYDNKYLFQTKNPFNIISYIPFIPKESIICTTIESNRNYPEMGSSPSVEQRVFGIKKVSCFCKTMITIEPIMDFDIENFSKLILGCNPFQVNIGADSKNSNLDEPYLWKIEELIINLEKFTKVHIKDNLNRLLKENK